MKYRFPWAAAIGAVTLAVWGGLACSAASQHVERGDELMRANLPEEALTEYHLAAEAAPENPEIGERLGEAKRVVAANANSEGLGLLEMKDPLGAVAAFKKAVQNAPDEASYKQNLVKATQEVLAEAKKQLEEKRFLEATELLRKVLSALPKHLQAKQALAEAETAWSQELYEGAERFLQRKLYGNALVSLVTLKKIAGAYRESAILEAQAREELKKVARFGIQLWPVEVPKRLVEPTAKLLQLLSEVSVAKCPTAALGVPKGAKLIISTGVEELSFDSAREVSTASQKYQSGIRKVDNPKYQEIQKRIEDARARIGALKDLLKADQAAIKAARQAFEDAGPGDDEGALRTRLKQAEGDRAAHRKEREDKQALIVASKEELGRTPKKLDEPVFDEQSYEVFKVTRTALARVKVSAKGEGGVRLLQEKVEGSGATSDTTNPPDKKFGIAEDPLQFPKTDGQLTDEALKIAGEHLAALLSDQCVRWREEILTRASQAMATAPLEATEDYVLYLFVEPGALPPELGEFLKKQHGIDDPKKLATESPLGLE